MTSRYVDALIGASASYDPVARSATGGSDASYATLKDAYDACTTNVDDVYVRAGDNPLGVTLGWGKLCSIYRYEDEDAWIVGVDNSHGIQFVSGANGETFDLKFKDGGGNDKRGIYFNGLQNATFTRLEIQNVLGSCIYHAGGSTGNKIEQLILKDSLDTGTTGKSQGIYANTTSGGVLDIDVAYISNVYGCAVRTNTAFDVVTIGQLHIDGCNDDANPTSTGTLYANTGSSIEVHNILLLNTGLRNLSSYAIKTAGTGAVTLHEGIVHGNINRPNDYVSLGSNITFNNVEQNAYVKFDNDNSHLACMSFVCIDSNWLDENPSGVTNVPVDRGAEGIFLTASTDITNSFVKAGAKVTFLPDDQRTWVATDKDDYASLAVSAGMELGCEGESSSPMNELNPLNVTYTGAGAVVTLTVSGDGTVMVLDVDGTPTEYDLTLDSSGSGTAAPYIGNASTSGNYLYQKLNLHADITCIINADSASWDDTLSTILDDAIYDLKTGAKDIAMNRERYLVTEIDETKSQTLSLAGATPTSYYQALYTGGESDVASRLAGQGFLCAIGQTTLANAADTNLTVVDTINKFNLAVRPLESYLGDGTQAETEAFADVFATCAQTYGEWGIQLLAGLGNTRDSEFWGWLIARLKLRGISIKTLSEGAEFYSSSITGEIIAGSDSRVENDSLTSDHAGTGTKWWTGANPVDLNGEPFSDFDTDIGVSQSTHGPFHPKNL